jgi:hypothetical protein
VRSRGSRVFGDKLAWNVSPCADQEAERSYVDRFAEKRKFLPTDLIFRWIPIFPQLNCIWKIQWSNGPHCSYCLLCTPVQFNYRHQIPRDTRRVKFSGKKWRIGEAWSNRVFLCLCAFPPSVLRSTSYFRLCLRFCTGTCNPGRAHQLTSERDSFKTIVLRYYSCLLAVDRTGRLSGIRIDR